MKRSLFRVLLLLSMVTHSFVAFSAESKLKVVVSIPPLAAMIKPVLPENTLLTVLLKPGASPHGFKLKPSARMALREADVVLSLGTVVDAWLHKALKAQQKQRPELKSIAMSKLSGVLTLPNRHKHHEHHHHGDKHGHEDHHSDHNSPYDPHLWLAPSNALLMLEAFNDLMGSQLNQTAYKAWHQKLKVLAPKIKQTLQPVHQQPYVVLHDAFRYFEEAGQLNFSGTIQLSDHIKPSIKHILHLREEMVEKQVKCVVKEPQFPDKQVDYVVQDLPYQVGVVSIDHLGGRDKVLLPYDDFMLGITDGFLQCLSN